MNSADFYERWILMPLVFGVLIVVGIPLAIVFSPLWIVGEIGIRTIELLFKEPQ